MTSAALHLGLREATLEGLQQKPKELPTVWLYDKRGSQLYEEVTRLSEYYPPRREREILRDRSPEIAALTHARTLVELGAGNASRTRLLLDALASTLERFVPLDVSEEFLRSTAEAVAAEYPRLAVDPFVGDFERDLHSLPAGGPRLIALLGSTIGNFYPAQRRRFLGAVAGALEEEDAFLVGLDLVKDVPRLEAAYNDECGVTETFVRNALAAVNRELDATFDQHSLGYSARWDPEHEWMDIGFRARHAHRVSIRALDLELAFAENEQLRVEVSSKFRRERFELEAREAALAVDGWWTDEAGDFALALMTRNERRGSCP
ncbi:MAG: L-histidine N(alpha)-methyltransferase [Gaiellaceae bacterium]|jgi:L-histidine N-alpha-methyltransferase